MKMENFDNTDWECFSGAEKPPHGEPKINYEAIVDGHDAVVVADASGLTVHVHDHDSDGHGGSEWAYYKEMPFDDAIEMALYLPKDMSGKYLELIGLKKV